ncbi:MAG: hypothetical protein AB7G88_15550 [Thermomicrobiales bacterium]
MRHLLLLIVLLLAGCGGGPKIEKRTPITLDQIPPEVMKVAREKLSDVKFDRAWRKENGEYEIAGKNRNGKVREIDIRPDGTVTEIE